MLPGVHCRRDGIRWLHSRIPQPPFVANVVASPLISALERVSARYRLFARWVNNAVLEMKKSEMKTKESWRE